VIRRKLGRNRPVETAETHPQLFRSVRRYMAGKSALPVAPAKFAYGPEASGLQDILGNDSLGDCTSAGRSHIIDAITASAEDPVSVTLAQTIQFYSASTGYVVGNPASDQGGDEITVLTTWRDQGAALDGHTIAGWVSIDPSDAALVKSAMYLFENLYFGLELDPSFEQIDGNGFTWGTGTPDPSKGHCVVGVGADENGIQIDTWGLIGTITYAAIAQFCAASAGGNLFAVLTPEIVSRASGKTPGGFDWAGLLQDFAGLGGAAIALSPSVVPASEEFSDTQPAPVMGSADTNGPQGSLP
jgi:hypothetical protein